MLRLRTRALFVMLATLCACAASAQERYVCRLGNSERIIEVIYASPPSKVPCEVSYTKSSGAKSLWRSQNEIGFCEVRAREFAEQQSRWGWHCSEPQFIDEGPVVDDGPAIDESPAETTGEDSPN